MRVNLADRSYDIAIGAGNLSELPAFIRARSSSEHLVLITDNVVDQLYADALADRLTEHHFDVNLLAIEKGEQSKSVDVADDLWNEMLDQGADRQTIVLAVGGGVVGDLAGFVAAAFARGLDFIQAPTTLLAQVDSSVGGKVGVNLPGAKNMVGAFWQPLGVLIDVDVLQTLPDNEYRAGLAEVVKYGVILDADFFSYLEQHVDPINQREPSTLMQVVERCCQLKANVVEADERETTGLRAVLNYGHTFAHAFESITGYGSLLHGEAVAAGMRCAARLAERLGRVDKAFVDRQEALLRALALSFDPPAASPDDLLQLMSRDKKSDAGQIRFILPDRMGHVELVGNVPPADVAASLEA